MQAWGNHPEVRQHALDVLTTARKRGMLYHGSYFCGPIKCDSPTGCAVGTIYMSIQGDTYEGGSVVAATASLVDLPVWLMRTVEVLFESESEWHHEDALAYPERVLRAIPVGLELPDHIPDEIRAVRISRCDTDVARTEYRENLVVAIESYIERLLAEREADQTVEAEPDVPEQVPEPVPVKV